MTTRNQYAPNPTDVAQFCQLWAARVDALECHLSAKMWAMRGLTVALIAYPIARIVIPAAIHAAVSNVVPDVVRNVLSLI